MNKKAQAFLIIAGFAFMIATVVFYTTLADQKPGGETLYLGENEVDLYTTYFQAEKDMYFIELSASLAAQQASEDNFEADFEQLFNEYLQYSQMNIEDYELTYTLGEETSILGITATPLVYEEEKYTYSILPNFKVKTL